MNKGVLRREGRNAHLDGATLPTNPYEKDTAEHKLWVAGWRDARHRKRSGGDPEHHIRNDTR